MGTKVDQLIGYCGLYCGNCLYYLNTVKGCGTLEEDGTVVFCEGRNSGVNTPYCSSCDIKNCNRNKELRYCLQCGDFPCNIITGFMESPGYAYHKDVPAMMERLKEIGPEAWAVEMEAGHTCKNCGIHFTYFDYECPNCKIG
jgi:hypothetical protein